MRTRPSSRLGGFTLVEIMIVVAIIAILASIAVPSFMRARKRSQATTTLNALRVIDNAKDQYAIENSRGSNITPNGADLALYVKRGSKLYNDLLSTGGPVDALGAAISINGIDVPPNVASTTKSALSDALGGATGADTFFGAYK